MTDTEVQPQPTIQLPVGRGRLRGHGGATADDARLVAAARAQDPDALGAIFDRYGLALLSFCRHMLGSREEAEDAVQHVMLSAHQALLRSEDEIHLRAWLFAIARNRCRSMLRARRAEVPLDDVDRWTGTDGLAAEVERREDLRAMLGDLRRLPEEQRAALLLAELGAHSHKEIATVLGVRTGKVKALVYQAREALAAARTARETPCAEIREQLATLRGSALRRAQLRRHVEGCPGCRAFQAEVARQGSAFAVLLSVAPSASLKSSVLGVAAVTGGGAAAGGGVAAGGLLAIAQGGVTKLLAAAAVGAAGGGGYVAITDHGGSSPPQTRAVTAPVRAGGEHVLRTPVAGGLVPVWVPAPAAAQPLERRPAGSGAAPGSAQRRPARSARGVAPGHVKRSAPGASSAAPGHAKRSASSAPGASGAAPGHAVRSASSASSAAPGHAKQPAPSAPGSTGRAPGRIPTGRGQAAAESRSPQPAPAPASDPAAAPVDVAPAGNPDLGGQAAAAPHRHGRGASGHS